MAAVLPPGRNPSPSGAFSLVEVALTLGIIAVSLLSLIGLLPVGLGTLRASMDQTAHAQIVRYISAGLASTDLGVLSNESLTFDDQGQLIEGASAANNPDARYAIHVQLQDPSLPGVTPTDAGDLDKLRGHLSRVRIGISRANVSNAAVDWYAIQVARR